MLLPMTKKVALSGYFCNRATIGAAVRGFGPLSNVKRDDFLVGFDPRERLSDGFSGKGKLLEGYSSACRTLR